MHLRLTVPSIALLALLCKHAGAIRRGLKNAGAGLHAHQAGIHMQNTHLPSAC